jgi:hypothetical protein
MNKFPPELDQIAREVLSRLRPPPPLPRLDDDLEHAFDRLDEEVGHAFAHDHARLGAVRRALWDTYTIARGEFK